MKRSMRDLGWFLSLDSQVTKQKHKDNGKRKVKPIDTKSDL